MHPPWAFLCIVASLLTQGGGSPAGRAGDERWALLEKRVQGLAQELRLKKAQLDRSIAFSMALHAHARSDLLLNVSVARELGLNPQQRGEAKELFDWADRSLNTLNAAPLDPLDAYHLASQAAEFRGIYHGIEVRLDLLLHPDQRRRSFQIGLQVLGLHPDEMSMFRTLDLSSDQYEQMRAILNKAVETRGSEDDRPGRPLTINERQEGVDRLQTRHRRTFAEISALLDEEQRRAWDVLIGPPFRLMIEGP